MVVIGVVLIATGGGWAQTVGTGVLGAGFAVVVSTLTSRRAIQEQYAKDANLRRKDLYAPLHAQIKKVREYLERAKSGDTPYPQHIDVGGGRASESMLLPGSGLPKDALPLDLWSDYTTDYRRTFGFTEDSQRRFDALRDRAVAYRMAVDAAREPTSSILEPHIEAAVQHALADPTYQQEKKALGGNVLSTNGEPASDKIERWIAHLDRFTGITPNVGKEWSLGWVEYWGQQRPATLGWLLARQPQRAAKHVYSIYEPDPSRNHPPLDWFDDIFREAWPELERHAAYQNVWHAERMLFDAVRDAESRLKGELRYIQERFEGGPPHL